MAKQRNYSVKPSSSSFGPLTQTPKEMLDLSADELEAMVLADFRGLYQEECAAALGVSRPTFAKLIKRARRKMVEMILFGKGISVVDAKRNLIVAFPTNDRAGIHEYFLTAKMFAFAKVENGSIVSIAYKENPLYLELLRLGSDIVDDDSAAGLGAGRIIPPLFKGVDLILVRSIGEGIRRNIEGSGVNIEMTRAAEIDEALKEIV